MFVTNFKKYYRVLFNYKNVIISYFFTIFFDIYIPLGGLENRHDNGTGRGWVLSPQFLTPTPQHILIPDTRQVKIYYIPSLYSLGIGYFRPHPISIQVRKKNLKENIKNLILEKIN